MTKYLYVILIFLGFTFVAWLFLLGVYSFARNDHCEQRCVDEGFATGVNKIESFWWEFSCSCSTCAPCEKKIIPEFEERKDTDGQ